MNVSIHKAQYRGSFENDWLKAKYSFSFSDYFNPNRLGVGRLKVLNDDVIKAKGGFATHPHKNMEIITIVLEGAIAHKDSAGHEGVIKPGQIQTMSAGKGIRHSEFNPLKDKNTNLLQIWIEPNQKNVEPVYQNLDYELKDNEFTKIVSGNATEGVLKIYQDANLYLAKTKGIESLALKSELQGSHLFLMLIDGEIELEDATLKTRDAVEISDWTEVEVCSKKRPSFILAIEVVD